MLDDECIRENSERDVYSYHEVAQEYTLCWRKKTLWVCVVALKHTFFVGGVLKMTYICMSNDDICH